MHITSTLLKIGLRRRTWLMNHALKLEFINTPTMQSLVKRAPILSPRVMPTRIACLEVTLKQELMRVISADETQYDGKHEQSETCQETRERDDNESMLTMLIECPFPLEPWGFPECGCETVCKHFPDGEMIQLDKEEQVMEQ
jgi:hypothetical protein